jgi:hypothetical protein
VERKENKKNNADISPVYRQGVLSTKDTQEEQKKQKKNKMKLNIFGKFTNQRKKKTVGKLFYYGSKSAPLSIKSSSSFFSFKFKSGGDLNWTPVQTGAKTDLFLYFPSNN